MVSRIFRVLLIGSLGFLGPVDSSHARLLLYDSFQDSSNTPLSNHTPEVRDNASMIWVDIDQGWVIGPDAALQANGNIPNGCRDTYISWGGAYPLTITALVKGSYAPGQMAGFYYRYYNNVSGFLVYLKNNNGNAEVHFAYLQGAPPGYADLTATAGIMAMPSGYTPLTVYDAGTASDSVSTVCWDASGNTATTVRLRINTGPLNGTQCKIGPYVALGNNQEVIDSMALQDSQPTFTPTARPTGQPTGTGTPSPAATATETPSAILTSSTTATSSATSTPTPSATATSWDTSTPTPSATATSWDTSTPTPSATATSWDTSTPTPSATATSWATPSPTCTPTSSWPPLATFTATPDDSASAADYGFTGIDDTAAIQSAINTGKPIVRIPREASAWMVRPGLYGSNRNACIVPNSGQTIIIADGATICPVANAMLANANSVVFDCTNAADITLTSDGVGTVWMRKAEVYGPVQAQFRHAIQIQNSSGIMVSNLQIFDACGDGVFMGGQYGPVVNCRLDNCFINNPNRHGICLDNAVNCVFTRCRTWNANAPGAQDPNKTNSGIHLEADFTANPSLGIVTSQFSGLLFDHCEAGGNTEAGIQIHLGNLWGAFGGNTVSVTFQSCTVSAAILGYGTGIKIIGPTDTGCPNQIVFNDCIVNSCTGSGLWLTGHNADTGTVCFNRCAFSNLALYGGNPLRSDGTDIFNPCTYPGGYAFNQCTLSDSRSLQMFLLTGYLLGHAQAIKNITGTIAFTGPLPAYAYFYNPRTNCAFTGLTVFPPDAGAQSLAAPFSAAKVLAGPTLSTTTTPWVIPNDDFRIFPNPAQTTVNFAYHVPGGGTIRLDVYSIAGERVAHITGSQNSGPDQIAITQWVLPRIAPGIYLARLVVMDASGKTIVSRNKKMAVIH